MAQDPSIIVYDVQATRNGKHGWNQIFHIYARRVSAVTYLPVAGDEDSVFRQICALGEGEALKPEVASHSGIAHDLLVGAQSPVRLLSRFAQFCGDRDCYSNGLDDAKRLLETAFVYDTNLPFIRSQLHSLGTPMIAGLRAITRQGVDTNNPSYRLLELIDEEHRLPAGLATRAEKNVEALLIILQYLKAHDRDALAPKVAEDA